MLTYIRQRHVVLANPIKIVSEQVLEATIASEPLLRLRGNEVLQHCLGVDSLRILEYNWPSPAWSELKVSEQVLLLRKHFPGDMWVNANKAYLTIPYSGTGVCMLVCIYVGVCMLVCICLCMCVGMYILVCIYMGISILLYI
jgi:hypothetical protein